MAMSLAAVGNQPLVLDIDLHRRAQLRNPGRRGGRQEYGVLVAMTSHGTGPLVGAPVAPYRIASVADRVGPCRRDGRWSSRSEWPLQQIVLIGVYAVAALWA